MATNMTGVPSVPVFPIVHSADGGTKATHDKGIVVQDKPVTQGGGVPDPKNI